LTELSNFTMPADEEAFNNEIDFLDLSKL